MKALNKDDTQNYHDGNYSQENPIYWHQESEATETKVTTTISKYYHLLLIVSFIISNLSFILALFVVTGVINVPADKNMMDIKKQEAAV